MGIKTIIKMAVVTMGAIYISNLLASMNTSARKLLKGSPVVGLPTNSTAGATMTEKKTPNGGAFNGSIFA